MYLKQIDIQGFKSFAEPTTISFVAGDFARATGVGMTAIVGPNGSGKSNVSDAIRWVMGEQSMKNLRGKKSDDVIFAGSDKKGKMSMARVALVFDNTDHLLPVEYDEVTIERKMYRNGEGEYRINGARVRLLDIIDALARAGLGKNSHCVVGQGMTDAILGATPIERRIMIEDAAGVKHFQLRKTRSAQKLERTKENLERTRELIAEVEPHLRTLKRQAHKAQKGKAVYEELKNLQRTYFAYVWQQFAREREDLAQQKSEVSIAMKNAQRKVDTLNERVAAEAQKVENANVVHTYEDEKRALYDELRTIERDLAVAQGRIEITKERKAAEQKVKSIPVDLTYVRSRLEEIQKQQEDLIAALDGVQDIAELAVIREKLHMLQDAVNGLYDDAGKKTVTLPQKDNTEKLEQHDRAIAKHEEAVAKNKKRQDSAQKRIAALTQKITQEVSQDQKAREQFFVLEKDLRSAQAVLDEAREKLNAIKIDVARVEVREEDLIAEVRQELGLEVSDLSHDGEEIDTGATELRINKLRAEYERIGGIDPMIVEEYEETQERFDFLSKESNDLEKAMTQLKEVIKEMDKKIHEAFVKAYKEINTEFTKYFRILFGGGNAKLTKVTIDLSPKKAAVNTEEAIENLSEDAPEEKKTAPKTEIGVEITAAPPGKKVQHLSLLSGGERSLTSIAMLFAIIAYNPPPFTVLDEVEAALDEANSRRLAAIFAELGTKTQFVIITHNRETMRHADVLYGVTMNNDGISQILSVKLDQLNKEGEMTAS